MYLCDLPLAPVSYFFSKRFDFIWLTPQTTLFGLCIDDTNDDEPIKGENTV